MAKLLGSGPYWGMTTDLEDAYLHVPMHKDSSKLLGVVVGKQYWTFNSLPFGLSQAPAIFQRLMVDGLKSISKDLIVFIYLDDLLVCGKSAVECQQATDLVRTRLLDLGWTINWAKSMRAPAQSFTYLGWVWDTVAGWARPTAERRDKLFLTAKAMGARNMVSLRDLQSLHGVVSSMALLDIGVLRHCRVLAQLIRGCGPVGPWQRVIPCPKEHCKMLCSYANNTPASPISPLQADWEVYTDASPTGWGVVVAKSPEWYRGPTAGFGHWPPHLQEARIELLGLKAAGFGVDFAAMSGATQGTVLVHIDSTVAQSYLHHCKGGRVQSLHRVTNKIAAAAESANLRVLATRVHTSKDCGTVSVCAQAFRWCQRRTHLKCTLDAFATRWNSKCTQFCSRYPDSKATLVDFMSLTAAQVRSFTPWINPPWRLWGHLVPKLLAFQNQLPRRWQALLLVPQWTTRWWYRALVREAKLVLPLPPLRDMYTDCWGVPFPLPQWGTVCMVLQGKLTC